MDKDKQVEMLLRNSCHVIDIFPYRVPESGRKAFEEAEEFFLCGEEMEHLGDKFVCIVVKTVCYFSYEVYKDQWLGAIDVGDLAGMIRKIVLDRRGFLNVLLPDEDGLIQICGGDIYLTVYHDSDRMKRVMRMLAESEGLFWREGCSG